MMQSYRLFRLYYLFIFLFFWVLRKHTDMANKNIFYWLYLWCGNLLSYNTKLGFIEVAKTVTF